MNPSPLERSILYATLIQNTVRPLDLTDHGFCSECRNQWHDCECDLPTFEQAKAQLEEQRK